MSAPEKLGKYRLEQKIAVGGMAEIWLSRQEGPAGFSKRLVVKRILPNLANDAKFVEMFLDEARVAALLEHPNIVRISDLGQVDGSYFIAMEFIDGPDLDYLIARASQLKHQVPSVVAARIVADALNGLDYAHHFADEDGQSLGLVHRDISPHNILISGTGVAKVCDFGVAKVANSRHQTQAGAVKGKFAYMSPEQIAAKALDGRSDVFAMGIVLYELTTNQRPFGDQGELMAVTAILTQQPTDPRQFVKNFPSELEQIILKALSKNREDRYRSAHHMQEELERFLQASGQVVTPRDVAVYIQDLFSQRPSFWAEGAEAPPPPPRYEVDGRLPWEERAQTGYVPARGDDPLAVTADSPQLTREAPPTPPPVATREVMRTPTPRAPEGGGNKGLAVALAAVLLLVLAVAAGGAWYLFGPKEGGEGDPDAEVAEADVEEVEADVGVAQADAVVAPDAVAAADVEGAADVVVEADVKAPREDAGAAVATGRVVFVSQPAVKIFREGVELGVTPITLKLPLGEQELVLKEPGRGIFKKVSLKVDAAVTGEVSEIFEFGSVRVKVPQGKALWIDGAPFAGDAGKPIALNAGKHTLQLGVGEAVEGAAREVEVRAGKEAEVRF